MDVEIEVTQTESKETGFEGDGTAGLLGVGVASLSDSSSSGKNVDFRVSQGILDRT